MFKDKLKKIVENSEEQGNNKRKIENLVFLVIILIITVVIINYVWSGEKSSNKKVTNSTGKQLATINNNQTLASSQYNNTESISLEEKLEDILSKIEGVGSVKVFINYSESSETVAMYNENSKTSTTEETDKSGGTRKVEQTDSQKEVIYQEQNGTKTPIVQKTVEPKIEGAIITAKGAGDINVKTSIIQAVEAATGLATHKIQVFTMSV